MTASTKRRYFKEMRFQQLRALLEVGRCGSFAGAATALDLATPTVWQQVKGLEAEFGVELARVHGNAVELTEDGRVLAEMAQPLIQDFEALHDAFLQRIETIPKRLILVSTTQLLRHELKAPLRSYREQWPKVQLSIVDGPSAAGREMLEHGEADVAIVGRAETSEDQSLTDTCLTAYPTMLIAPASHPLHQSPRLTLNQLLSHPLYLPSAITNTRQRIDRVLSEAGLSKRLMVAAEANNFDLLLDLISQGGVALLCLCHQVRCAIQEDSLAMGDLAIRDVSRLFGSEQIVYIRRARRIEPNHHRAFRELVEQSIQQAAQRVAVTA